MNVLHEDEATPEGEEEPVTKNHTNEDLTWNDAEYILKFIKTGKSVGIDEIKGEKW